MKQIHVNQNTKSNICDGSLDNPYKTINDAINHIEKGVEVIVHEGVYGPFVVDSKASGTKDEPVLIRSADNESVIIQGVFDENAITVYLVNVENITIQGFEVVGGGLGIYCVSTPDINDKTLDNITISNCVVHKVRGMHGIAVYAKNDLAPIKNLVMKDCEVYDCRLDSSESTVFNGNIDGFTICNNVVHDNNNIGIDMIGFEGKAKHNNSYKGNLYDVDFVRNGKCFNNFVYNISSFDNEAYFENPLASIKDTTGEYNLCANGIYVDGGQNIEIYDNFIYNCDIGIEVSTEHSPDDNEMFKVSGMNVHDNVICGCVGYSGLAIGGYAKNLGFTEECIIHNNTFIDNNIGMIVQRSRDNVIKDNIFVGGQLGIEFNHGVLKEDQVNNYENNIFCTCKDINDYFDFGGKDLNYLMKNKLNNQTFIADRNKVINNYKCIVNGIGSSYLPNNILLDSYKNYVSIGISGIEKAYKYITDNFKEICLNDVIKIEDNICNYINKKFKENNLENASVELIKVKGKDNFISAIRNYSNGDINKSEIGNIDSPVNLEFHLRYRYENNSYAHKWVRNINIK